MTSIVMNEWTSSYIKLDICHKGSMNLLFVKISLTKQGDEVDMIKL